MWSRRQAAGTGNLARRPSAGTLEELIEVDVDFGLTGFSTGELDLLSDGKPEPATDDPADDLTRLSL
jgi:hypothetical protein